ncbi:unnamed protein product, partial [Musa acuminata subsp. burmannicoides]
VSTLIHEPLFKSLSTPLPFFLQLQYSFLSLVFNQREPSPWIYKIAVMAKCVTFFVIAVLLSFSLGQAARHESVDPRNTQQEGAEADGFERVDEGCGAANEEECLMRRTLVAHTDYIYTQGNRH